MDSAALSGKFKLAGLPVLAAGLLLCHSTLAATGAASPCEQVGRDLQSLEVPVNDIGVESVDHVPLDSELDVESTSNKSISPVLNLGPRVSSIVRDIFESTDEETVTEQTSSSPLADSERQPEHAESDKASEESSELPRFQRLMRRTDI